jgi:hypothetical protein
MPRKSSEVFTSALIKNIASSLAHSLLPEPLSPLMIIECLLTPCTSVAVSAFTTPSETPTADVLTPLANFFKNASQLESGTMFCRGLMAIRIFPVHV